jgi:hypothetical protein
MRRTSLLVVAASCLVAALGPTAQVGTVAQPIAVEIPTSPQPSSSLPVLPTPPDEATPPVTEQASDLDAPTDTAAQAEGQAKDAGTPGTASASQRPALTSVLDPAAGATIVAAGSTIAGTGPAHRYSVEVEPSIGLDVELVRAIVEDALHDTERSWARTRTLQRVDDPTMAPIRIVVASPATVDAICATVGLNTAGIFSCWTGRVAALNAWRWEVGAAGFPDAASYRTYLVNHEFGHALGYGHVGCPRTGTPAPVMMQQSKGLSGCVANGWPYP